MNEQRADSDSHSENRELRATVRRFLSQHATEAKLWHDIDSRLGFDEQVWQRFAGELGLAGLNVPEALGGGGATFAEHCLVLEDSGARRPASIPVIRRAERGQHATNEQHDHKRIQPARTSATRWDVLTACHRSWAVMITL